MITSQTLILSRLPIGVALCFFPLLFLLETISQFEPHATEDILDRQPDEVDGAICGSSIGGSFLGRPRLILSEDEPMNTGGGGGRDPLLVSLSVLYRMSRALSSVWDPHSIVTFLTLALMLLGLGRILDLSEERDDLSVELFVLLLEVEGFKGGIIEGTSTGGGVSPPRSY